MVFFPAYDPELVVTVVVDYPKGSGIGGGSVCGPVFKNIAKACIAYLGIRADRQAISSFILKETSYDQLSSISDYQAFKTSRSLADFILAELTPERWEINASRQ